MTADWFHTIHSYLPLVKRSRNFQYVGLRFCTSITACVNSIESYMLSFLSKKKRKKKHVREAYVLLTAWKQIAVEMAYRTVSA